MPLANTLTRPYGAFVRFFDFLSPFFDLVIRLWVAKVFFQSGLTKIQSWESTRMLFEYEYNVPLLPPHIAAYLGTATELGLPVFIALGLMGRLSALVLFVFNIVAVFSYSEFLFSREGAGGLQQHILWGTMIAMILFHGPGRLSLDYLIKRRVERNGDG